MRSLKDCIAAVTGAANGLGRAVALELARQGAHLALADVDEARLRETVRAVEAAGRRASAHRVDVADRRQVERFAAEAGDLHGGVQILVNNAGVALVGRFEEQRLEDLEWIFGVNLWGTLHGCRAFLPLLRAAEEAHIVLVSSVLGLFGGFNLAAYSATKHAVAGFGEALRRELEGTGVAVSVVHPGRVSTGIARNARWSGPDDPQRRSSMDRLLADRGLPPERTARRIVRGIRRQEPRVLVGQDAWLADLLQRLRPGLASALFAWRSRRDSW